MILELSIIVFIMTYLAVTLSILTIERRNNRFKWYYIFLMPTVLFILCIFWFIVLISKIVYWIENKFFKREGT